MALRPHSSCLQGKTLPWRIRPVQAAFALQFHQSCLHFHDPVWSHLSVPVWQARLLQKHLLLRAFLLYFHPVSVFFSLYAFFLHFSYFCFSLWCASHCFFCITSFHLCILTYFAVLVIPTTNRSVCFSSSPFSCPFLLFSSLLPYTGNQASFQPADY